jgi:hypothetical protein
MGISLIRDSAIYRKNLRINFKCPGTKRSVRKMVQKITYFLVVMPVPDQVRDDGSGIQLCKALKKLWIPGQARNDNAATYALLTIATQPLEGEGFSGTAAVIGQPVRPTPMNKNRWIIRLCVKPSPYIISQICVELGQYLIGYKLFNRYLWDTT